MKTIKATIGSDSYKTIITNGINTIIADEPAPYGNDEGLSPYDFLLSALGACVVMTLRMYADRKTWDLQKVEVEISQEKIHHEDCKDCESTEGYVHSIEKKIKLYGDLDEAQHKRLMEIADRCPVQKTLQNEIVIHTTTL